MKTAERILSTALALFNEHGESSVSSVDIANECDISPGNLYYHFKGKAQLVDGLMKLHKAQMDDLLDTKKLSTLHIDDVFYYFFLVIQKLNLFRFLYRSPADLMEKYPHFAKSHARLLKQLEDTIQFVFEQCEAKQTFSTQGATIMHITQLSALIITQSCQYDELIQYGKRGGMSSHPEEAQYHALSLLITALLPRCALSDKVLAQLMRAIELHQLPSGG
ncbi:TetR/AcrR family transcriptional regulator [Alteromonas sediminis]|uniref:TetR/AcrR family transcriptional regulator n=1 Tax=Alteromonas sediminis TaxID=2259342 RepID=A0A3N5XYP9_9ALTE|nr:TetR/AcrR family transcriptional regulator [Alteromonas sediminis]RPJ65096.1 TetR/AcrR family transcriptional regulator [Alteromonas sediminis]